jgi:hypothetical protein
MKKKETQQKTTFITISLYFIQQANLILSLCVLRHTYRNIIIFDSTGKRKFKFMRITSYISQYHYI